MRILRKGFILVVGAALLMAGGIASADVILRGTVNVTKDVLINENITITKSITLNADVIVDAENAAESLVVINQTNTQNPHCTDCQLRTDTITNSILDNTGITSVNQTSSDQANQGTAIAIVFEEGAGEGGNTGFADGQAAVDQSNTANDVNFPGNVPVLREALIENSVNTNVGITAVNQSSGTHSNQANGVAGALTVNGGVALAENALGQENTTHTVTEFDITKSANLFNSVNQNMGIVGANQTAGNNANQANVVSFGAAINAGLVNSVR